MATTKKSLPSAKKTVVPAKPAAKKPAATQCAASACACKAAAKPAAKPVAKPAPAPAAKLPVQTAAPAAKSVAKPVAKPAAKPQAARPVATPPAAPTHTSVTFTLNANPGSLVAVAGSFNDWDPLRHPLTDADGTGCYRVTLALAPGSYEYKFVINGTWCVDPNCPDWAQNEYGTLNSVRKV